jgi:hypothetical protein
MLWNLRRHVGPRRAAETPSERTPILMFGRPGTDKMSASPMPTPVWRREWASFPEPTAFFLLVLAGGVVLSPLKVNEGDVVVL